MTGMNSPALLWAAEHQALALLGGAQAGADRVDHSGPIWRPLVGDVQQGRHDRLPAQFGQAVGDWLPGPRPNRGAVDQDEARCHGGHPSRAAAPEATDVLTL